MDKNRIKQISERISPKLLCYTSLEFASLCQIKKHIQEVATKDFSEGDKISIARSEICETVFSKLTKVGRELYKKNSDEDYLFMVSYAIAHIIRDYEWKIDYFSYDTLSYISRRVEDPKFDLEILLHSHLDAIDAYCNSCRNWTSQNLLHRQGFREDVENSKKEYANLSLKKVYEKIEATSRNIVVNQYHWDEFDVDGFSWAIGTGVCICVAAGILPSFDEAFKTIFWSYVNNGLERINKTAIDSDYPNDPNELFDLGYNYYNGEGCTKNLHNAVVCWEKAALKGHVMAQYNLAQCYENAIGVSKDLIKMFYWYQEAAKNGDVDAIYNTGYNYYTGRGCIQDYKKSVRYFKIAADKQYIKAIYNLGICYRDGTGVPVKINRAIELFQQAANQGHEKAKRALQQMLSTYHNNESFGEDDDFMLF